MPGVRAILNRLLPVVLGLAGIVVFAAWWRGGPMQPIAPRLPGTDRTGTVAADAAAAGDVHAGVLTPGDGTASDLPGDWPWFRGPQLDGISHETVPLLDAWPEAGPPVVWRLKLGEGYAGAAIHRGRVYVLDFDMAAQADTLRCLALADGRELWHYAYPMKARPQHGVSRTVPAVTDRFVVTLGPKCHVLCLDATTGEKRWALDLVREYGTIVPPWYAGQCPLIDGERVILAPGGPDVLLLALKLDTGEVLWQAPNPRRWAMSHASVLPQTLGGRATYVYAAHGGIAAVLADTGAPLWSTDAWRIQIATIATPVPVGERRLFLSGGYNSGSMFLDLPEADGKVTPTPGRRLPPELFGATQQTPLLYQDHLYGVRPSGELVCLDLKGDLRWTSGMARRFGIGPFAIADGKLFVVSDDGMLTMAKATPTAYQPLASAQVLHGHEAWGPIAVAGGRMIVRDLTEMVCLDLRKP